MSKKDLVSQMSSDVNIGIDEVVSVFVSQYEDKLFERKQDLSKQIKSVKTNLTSLDKRLEDSIDQSQYVGEIPHLNIKSFVDSVSVCWDEKGKNIPHVSVNVTIEDADNSSSYRGSISKTITVTTSKEEVKLHSSLTTEQEDLNGQLLEVMGQIKSVSRKERQIRGRISEMKLKESGFDNLLESSEMLSLIQLD
jgi:uncharacterized protein YdcH (DUF465 family)